MNSRLGLTLVQLFLGSVCWAEEIALQVVVVSKDIPDQVVMQEEDGMQSIALQRSQADGIYRGQVQRPRPDALASVNKLSLDYRLVASWAGWKEQVYLKLQSQLPATVALKLYRNQEAFNDVALGKIESLGTDLDSLVEKYCRARAFHRNWRFEKKLPDHFIALRSARIWFDAAVALATRSHSPFGMDRDVQKIMDDYESRANTDVEFKERYRKYSTAGYVARMLDEVKIAEYAFVGLVPKLSAEGKYKEALDLNAKAMTVLSDETATTRKLVEKRQGVNLDLLRNNAFFLATKVGM
jgi:hypothetical protein